MYEFEASNYFNSIKKDHVNSIDKRYTSRKIFLSYPTYIFLRDKNFDIEFEIKDKISNFFKVPIYSIHFCGSAKTGRSLFKHTDFNPIKSDLDVAIISSELFVEYFEISFNATKGFKDLTPFNRIKGRSMEPGFKQYLNIGYFRPDLMPNCGEKTAWNDFFNEISNTYSKYFSNINAGIFLSQLFFEYKQIAALDKSIEYKFQE